MRNILAGLVLCTVSVSGYGAIVDFSGLPHGTIVTNQIPGMTVSADNPNRPFDLAIIFDTNVNNTADPDLEGPVWSAGNLAPNTDVGNILIIAENNTDANGNGLIDSPDDEGNRPAGKIFLNLATTWTGFGFDLIDIDNDVDEDGGIKFLMGNSVVGFVGFDDIVNPNSPHYRAGVVYGDHSANRIAPLSILSNGQPMPFNKIVVEMGGSGGIGRLNLVPEPSALLMLGVAGLAVVRRR